MTHIEVWLMALALAMDCFAVSIASGIIFKRIIWRPMLTMAFLFGFFQALNPFLGWWGTDQFRNIIESIDQWLALAIATSIDALAVGISFSCMGYHNATSLYYPLSIIFLVSFVLSIVGLGLGLKFGKGFAQKMHAEMWGGIILLLIGGRVLIEHLTA